VGGPPPETEGDKMDQTYDPELARAAVLGLLIGGEVDPNVVYDAVWGARHNVDFRALVASQEGEPPSPRRCVRTHGKPPPTSSRGQPGAVHRRTTNATPHRLHPKTASGPSAYKDSDPDRLDIRYAGSAKNALTDFDATRRVVQYR
jgi:hypothetical protein